MAAVAAQEAAGSPLSASLERLAELSAALGHAPEQEQLDALRSLCAGAAAGTQGQALSASAQKQLWEGCAALWNRAVEMSAGGAAAPRTTALLRQAACDLCCALDLRTLPPKQKLHALTFLSKTGQAWKSVGEFEAADALLARALQHTQALQEMCFERGSGGWGPTQSAAAALLFGLLQGRLEAALALQQQMLASGLTSQARAFAADPRLPVAEATALRLALVATLRAQGEQLARAGKPEAALPLLSATYEVLGEVKLGPEGGAPPEAEAEVVRTVCSVLLLLAWCHSEGGQCEQALSCLQGLAQMDPEQGHHFNGVFLLHRVLLQLGRLGEAETELLRLIHHEDVPPEVCAAALEVALLTPGGAGVARAALPELLQRFPDDAALMLSLVRAALSGGAAQAEEGAGKGGAPALGTQASPAAAGAAGASAVVGGGGAGGSGSSGRGGVSEGEGLALELASDDRVVECVGEDPTQAAQLLALLHNHAVARLQAQSFPAAQAFFAAALPLTQEPAARAACLRAQALCALGSGRPSAALECLSAASGEAPGSPETAMLTLKAHLAAGDGPGAMAAIQTLASLGSTPAGAAAGAVGEAGASTPDLLRLACCECHEAGAPQAAAAALRALLARLAADPKAAAGQPPGYEATLFQNLAVLAVEEAAAGEEGDAGGNPGDDPGAATGVQKTPPPAAAAAADAGAARAAAALAGVLDAAVQRLRTLGPDVFFAQQHQQGVSGGGGGRPAAQQEWFWQRAWNGGMDASASGQLQQAAVLLAVAGDVLSVHPAPDCTSIQRQRMAYLMAAAAVADVHAERPPSEGEALLPLAHTYLGKAREAGAALAAHQQGLVGGEAAAVGADAKMGVYALLLEFMLASRSCDVPGQLAALASARALPSFGAEHFALAAQAAQGLQWAGAVVGGGQQGGAIPPGGGGMQDGGAAAACPEAARAALQGALARLTSTAPLDYPAVATVLRLLLGLTAADADKLALLGEAKGVLAAAPAGSYPSQELRWLVTTAWNRGATHARLGRPAEAERYMRWAAEAVRADPKMAAEYGDVMLTELQKQAQRAEADACVA